MFRWVANEEINATINTEITDFLTNTIKRRARILFPQ